ncbi:MAG: AAA family ATPase [bacterium]|nr:AAA family ATPase [bacterium]
MDRALIDDLSRPDAYPLPARRIETLQTHISRLFFAGSRVYKLKKDVELGFLDFTTLERRRHFCEEEVRLNQRLAPDVYLGVVPVTREEGGRHRIGGSGTVVEWAVEMRRLPSGRMLDVLLAAGEIDNGHLDQLARLLVGFHAAARSDAEVAAYGTPAAIAVNLEENFAQTEPFTQGSEPILSPALHGHLAARGRAFLAESNELLERRVREGRVREGHGDLHAGNICFEDDAIRIYDCIEFSDRFRCSDVACELAFLAMDLDLAGFSAFGQFLIRRYAELAEDPDLAALIGPYKEYRAIVRAKVACFAAAGGELPAASAADKRLEAMRYFHLAAEYSLGRPLVLMCGLPASGKSWIAKRVARALDAALYASDVRRRSVVGAGGPVQAAAWGAGAYSAECRALTYDSLLQSTRTALGAGRGVVVDATFGRRAQRAPFVALAQEQNVPCLIVRACADEATIRARMEERSHDPHAVSQADLAVYERAREAFEAPDEVPTCVEVWPDEPIEAVVAAIVEARL